MFINADDYEILPMLASSGELNLYTYCLNNPIALIDPAGTNFWSWFATGVLTIVSIAAVTLVATGVVASGGVLGAVFVGAGVGSLLAMGGNIIAQGGFYKADPLQVVKSGLIGAVIGAISGATSWLGGRIGASWGQMFGARLSNTIHLSSGIEFGKVFGNFLSHSFEVTGGVVGGLIGGSFANQQANLLFGNKLSSEQIIHQGINSEIPMWLINLCQRMVR